MTTDRDGNRSNPYKPNPEMCCEACAFGGRDHAEWCEKYLAVEFLNGPAPHVAAIPSPVKVIDAEFEVLGLTEALQDYSRTRFELILRAVLRAAVSDG